MPTSPRRVTLPQFLLEQGCLDPRSAAPYLAQIATDKLSASILKPAVVLPPNPTFAQVCQYGLHPEYGNEKEIPALSIPSLRTEIQKAARGLQADWTMLDEVVLSIPDSGSASESTVKPLKRITAAAAHEARILRTLEDLGVAPLALPEGEQGKRGIKSRVREHIGVKTPKNPDGLSDAQFDKAWNAALKSGVIRTG
ncbi:hypothetical protein [uncultured Pseudoxanthomonas sp.]|uniref:hypothetical protein n=1 Tax=uncultured Pseudoxanthomonas sp. TaxID=281701 RepID=UPI00260D8C3E|nr:hypothetical protein [uncultured Pseudoxanthomonas sp.]